MTTAKWSNLLCAHTDAHSELIYKTSWYAPVEKRAKWVGQKFKVRSNINVMVLDMVRP